MNNGARQTQDSRVPLLSACIFASNRERDLDRCLASLHGVVDEIVFGDTGSRDGTPEVAARHGARVIEFEWGRDYGAARNRLIDEANGRYVLIVDSDEWLDPPDMRELRKFLRANQCPAILSSYYPKQGWSWMYSYRILLKTPHLRYEGAIHESIVPSLQRLPRSEFPFYPLVVRHSGFDSDPEAKAWFHIPLFQQALDADPANSYNLRCLAVSYHQTGRIERALACWQRSLDLIRTSSVLHAKDALTFFDLIQWQLDTGQSCADLVEEVGRLFPDIPLSCWYSGLSEMQAGDWKKAAPFFRRLLRWGEHADFDRNLSYHEGIFGAWSWEQLASCLFQMGQFGEAGVCFEKALASNAERTDLKMKFLLCRRKVGRSPRPAR